MNAALVKKFQEYSEFISNQHNTKTTNDNINISAALLAVLDYIIEQEEKRN